MSWELSAVEVRVLGALMEKAVTTPEYYPLTVNSLVLACNQKSSRDPVSDYDEEEVSAALDALRDYGLAMRVDVSGARTAKFRHQVSTRWELDDASYALLTVLLLRGPQTIGQLRSRTERLYPFRDLGEVQATLEAMQHRPVEPESLVQVLPRQTGSKEVRYAHTLGVVYEATESVEELAEPADGASRKRVPPPSQLAAEVDGLREELAELKNTVAELRQAFDEFKAQF